MRFLYLCRFNKRLSLFNQTLRYATKVLIKFSLMFSIVFLSFLCLFYLLFNSNIWSCSTLLQTAQMLFQMILLKFDASHYNDTATFLGPFCFTLFIILVVFIWLSIFISIINDSFCRARENPNDNEEIVLIMFTKFQQWIGMKDKFSWIIRFIDILGWTKPSKEEGVHDERDTTIRSEYSNRFELLADRVDLLLKALNRVSFLLT
jgi:hypothetical protein